MANFKDITGRVFGRLTVIHREPNNKNCRALWLCRCACGKEKIVLGVSLRRGDTTSCGCLCKEGQPANKTHGQSHSPTYKIWKDAKKRCFNQNHQFFDRYGGRGITMHEEWASDFTAFLRDVGTRPPGMTIDRYPNKDGNYEPGNVRWATRKEQANNRHSRWESRE